MLLEKAGETATKTLNLQADFAQIWLRRGERATNATQQPVCRRSCSHSNWHCYVQWRLVESGARRTSRPAAAAALVVVVGGAIAVAVALAAAAATTAQLTAPPSN